jgi:hypothetical protein
MDIIRIRSVVCQSSWQVVKAEIINVAFSMPSFNASKFAVRVFATDGERAVNQSHASIYFGA